MQCFRYKYCLEKPTFTRNKTDKLKQATQKYRSKLTNYILKTNYTLPRLYFFGWFPSHLWSDNAGQGDGLWSASH